MKAAKIITGAKMPALLVLFLIFTATCRKEPAPVTYDGFVLSSSEIGSDSLLPADYTCDGTSSTLPLDWTGAPSSTSSFVVIMHHVASPTDIHWYWILYNIPADVTTLPKNVTGIGTLGTNSVNDKTSYSPPCSQGPGLKAYTYTVYALSGKPTITVAANLVDRETMLNAIKDITLASASMKVYYARKVK